MSLDQVYTCAQCGISTRHFISTAGNIFCLRCWDTSAPRTVHDYKKLIRNAPKFRKLSQIGQHYVLNSINYPHHGLEYAKQLWQYFGLGVPLVDGWEEEEVDSYDDEEEEESEEEEPPATLSEKLRGEEAEWNPICDLQTTADTDLPVVPREQWAPVHEYYKRALDNVEEVNAKEEGDEPQAKKPRAPDAPAKSDNVFRCGTCEEGF